MTKLACIGDIHAHWPRLDSVLARIAREPGVAGVLMVGDLGAEPPWGVRRGTSEALAHRTRSLAEVLDRVASLELPMAWVPGNHDPASLPAELDARGNVDDRCVTFAGLRVVGVGGAGPHRFGFPYEWDEDTIRARAVPAGVDVLLCHAPPARTSLARTSRGHDAGSQAIRELAEAHAGVLVCGHIHEAPGAEVIGRCLCLNVGGLGQPHGRAQVGFVARGDSGGWSATWEDLEGGASGSWRLEPSR